jgi:hypothetical protein
MPQKERLVLKLTLTHCIAIASVLVAVVGSIWGASLKISGDVRSLTTAVNDLGGTMKQLEARVSRLEEPFLAGFFRTLQPPPKN